MGEKVIEQDFDNPQQRDVFGGGAGGTSDLSQLKVTTNVSGFLKITERVAGGKKAIENGFNLISASYKDDNDNSITVKNMTLYNADPENFYSEQAAVFTTKTLLKLISKNSKPMLQYKQTSQDETELAGWKVKGERLDLETAKSNLSKVIFFAYSYGGVFAGEICNVLKKCCEDLGYSKDETKEMLKEVRLVSVGNTLQSENPGMLFSSILIEATNDVVVRSNIENFKDISREGKIPPFMENVRDNILRIVTVNPTEKLFYPYDGDGKFIEPQLETSEQSKLGPKAHKIRFYSSYGPEHDSIMPVIIENSLKNMLFGEKQENLADYMKFHRLGHDEGIDTFKVVRKIYEGEVNKLIEELNPETKITI